MATGSNIDSFTNSKKDIRRRYNKISKWYDFFANWGEQKGRRIGLEMLNVKDGEQILEIGFGTGHLLVQLAKSSNKSGNIYGIDISDKMCQIAMERIRKEKLSIPVHIICGDAEFIPFPSNIFDGIIMCFTLELFAMLVISAVLDECGRILRNDGRICVISLEKHARENIIIKLYEWAHRKFPGYIDCHSIPVSDLIRDNGFAIEDEKSIAIWGLPVKIVLASKRWR
ncbi:2-heptaprenyl-1,4-naphthoquinone methyltransferase [bacterium]|nr:MAG: 2-heptaprenyl-1,4-naphthoquinone methyltransferase [bacterium]